jgi:hypothetical protein
LIADGLSETSELPTFLSPEIPDPSSFYSMSTVRKLGAPRNTSESDRVKHPASSTKSPSIPEKRAKTTKKKPAKKTSKKASTPEEPSSMADKKAAERKAKIAAGRDPWLAATTALINDNFDEGSDARKTLIEFIKKHMWNDASGIVQMTNTTFYRKLCDSITGKDQTPLPPAHEVEAIRLYCADAKTHPHVEYPKRLRDLLAEHGLDMARLCDPTLNDAQRMQVSKKSDVSRF